jgi:hypothetical protein
MCSPSCQPADFRRRLCGGLNSIKTRQRPACQYTRFKALKAGFSSLFSGWQMSDRKPARTQRFTVSGECSTVNRAESAGLHAVGSITSEGQPECPRRTDTSGVPSAFHVLEHPEARHGRGLSAFGPFRNGARNAMPGTGTRGGTTGLVASAFRVPRPVRGVWNTSRASLSLRRFSPRSALTVPTHTQSVWCVVASGVPSGVPESGTGTKAVTTPLVACAFQRVFQPLERLTVARPFGPFCWLAARSQPYSPRRISHRPQPFGDIRRLGHVRLCPVPDQTHHLHTMLGPIGGIYTGEPQSGPCIGHAPGDPHNLILKYPNI